MRIESLEAELALLKAEAEFIDKKKNGGVKDADRFALREARRVFRENHRQPVEDGAAPGAIGTKAEVTL